MNPKKELLRRLWVDQFVYAFLCASGSRDPGLARPGRAARTPDPSSEQRTWRIMGSWYKWGAYKSPNSGS